MQIAIIGAACRLPGVESLPELWELLIGGRVTTGPVPADRRMALTALSGNGDPDGSGFGGFLSTVDAFDHEFFGISAAESAAMDPQQRLFLEVAWHCLEDAGITREDLAGTATGVYVGQATHDHAMTVAEYGRHAIGPYSNTGLSHAVTANRMSYLWDLHGPSLAVDTACSSSLVAVHLAARALRDGDCDLAFAGGVNVLSSSVPQIGAARLTALSPDGTCRAFDRAANGYVRAEGAAVVLLKRLDDARRDGDRVLAVIKGTAVNQDGKTNGLTAPSGRAQTAVLAAALRDAELTVDDVDYIEAHGTGTPLGDPIEARALGTAFSGRRRPLLVGSVKANLGHLEAAAGIAGLVKALVMLAHRIVPGTANLRTVNPLIDTERHNVRFPTGPQPWPRPEPAVIGVSSFGFGGTNAHVIIGEAVDPAGTRPPGPEPASSMRLFLPVSGDSPGAVSTLAARFRDLVAATEDLTELRTLAAAATHRRSHRGVRAAAVGATATELADALDAIAVGEHPGRQVTTDARPRLVFVCSGHGSQWIGMGRGMLRSEPRFAAAARDCDAAFIRLLGWSVLDALRGAPDMTDVAVTQPLIFTIQVALAAALHDSGIVPDAVIGHSVGEVAAAVVSGRLGVADGCRVVVARNEAVRQARGSGGMAVVDLPAADATPFLSAGRGGVVVAASNSPRSTVLSGPTDDLDRVAVALRAGGHHVRSVNVDYPSHSPLMSGPAAALRATLHGMAHRPGGPVFYSSVTGASMGTDALPIDYWERNLRCQVRFADAVQAAVAGGATHLVELAPHPILLPALVECIAGSGGRVAAVRTMHRDDGQHRGIADIAGSLFEAGWAPTRTPCPAPATPMPAYPFDRRTVEITPAPPGPVVSPRDVYSAEMEPVGWLTGTTVCDVPAAALGPGHRVGGATAATAHGVAGALRRMARAAGLGRRDVIDLRITRPVELLTGTMARVSLTAAGSEQIAAVAVRSGAGAPWEVAASARLRVPGHRNKSLTAPPDPADRPDIAAAGRLRGRLAALDVDLGAGVDWLTGVTTLPGGRAAGVIDVPATVNGDVERGTAGLGDAAFAVLAHAVFEHAPPAGAGWAVTAIDEYVNADHPVSGARVQVHASVTTSGAGPVRRLAGQLQISDAAGRCLIRMSGITLDRTPPPRRTDAAAPRTPAPGEWGSPAARRRWLRSELDRELVRVIPGVPRLAGAGDVTFKDLGLDSLTAVELRNRLEPRLGLRLSVALFWAHPTPDLLVDALLARLDERAGAPTGPVAVPDPEPNGVEDLLAELAIEIELTKRAQP